MDLTQELTVFVITVGDEKNYAACIENLKAQTCTFKLIEIRNVAPMEAAFQQMLDQCETPYFVQVDEDMLLKPWAIAKLYQDITADDPKVGIWAQTLFDRHIGTGILGVKIYRHSVIKAYPFTSSFSCEMEQVARMQEDGFILRFGPVFCDDGDECYGYHGVYWTDRSIYQRYRNLMLRLRSYGWMGWMGRFPISLFERYEREPNNPYNRWAALGAFAGLVAPIEEINGTDKDFREYDNAEWLRVKGAYSPGPTGLNLYVTSKCNSNCSFCARQKGLVPTAPDVTAEGIKLLFQDYPTIRSVCVAGFGEPLMSENLPSILSCLKEAKKFVGLITNGLLLQERAIELSYYGLGSLSVSVNAGSSEMYENLTGVKNGFRKVLGGISAFSKVKGKCRLALSAVVTNDPRSVPSIERLLNFAPQLDVDEVHLLNLLPHDASDFDEFNRLHLSSTRPGDKAIVDQLRRHPNAKIVSVWPTLVGTPAECPWLCRSPWVSMGVDGSFNITGCQRIDGPKLANGKFFSRAPYPDTWHNSHFLDLRLRLGGDPPLRLGKNWSITAGGPKREQCERCFGNWKREDIPESR